MADKKTVYLATPKGPVSYFLEGAWLSLANGHAAPKKKRVRRTKAEMEAATTKEPTFKEDKKPATKKSSGKKTGTQSTI